MDRRELFGAFGALGVVPVCAAAGAAADHAGGRAGDGPMAGPHLHFCGIHMAKMDPKFQLITQHFCAAHTGGSEGDVFQCVLFDGTGKNAKLLGVEYILSVSAVGSLQEQYAPTDFVIPDQFFDRTRARARRMCCCTSRSDRSAEAGSGAPRAPGPDPARAARRPSRAVARAHRSAPRRW